MILGFNISFAKVVDYSEIGKYFIQEMDTKIKELDEAQLQIRGKINLAIFRIIQAMTDIKIAQKEGLANKLQVDIMNEKATNQFLNLLKSFNKYGIIDKEYLIKEFKVLQEQNKNLIKENLVKENDTKYYIDTISHLQKIMNVYYNSRK